MQFFIFIERSFLFIVAMVTPRNYAINGDINIAFTLRSINRYVYFIYTQYTFTRGMAISLLIPGSS